MSRITRIFVDMDEVLAAFCQKALEVHDLPSPYTNPKYRGSFNMTEGMGLTPSEFWSKINGNPTFWETLTPYPYINELMSILEEKVGSKNVYILTSPYPTASCYGGKLNWLALHLPRYANSKKFIPTANKFLLAQKGTLLIDDADHNVDAFRAHGGKAILVPRPSNSEYHLSAPLESALDDDRTLGIIKKRLNRFSFKK